MRDYLSHIATYSLDLWKTTAARLVKDCKRLNVDILSGKDHFLASVEEQLLARNESYRSMPKENLDELVLNEWLAVSIIAQDLQTMRGPNRKRVNKDEFFTVIENALHLRFKVHLLLDAHKQIDRIYDEHEAKQGVLLEGKQDKQEQQQENTEEATDLKMHPCTLAAQSR